jgi:hypothetical protein
MEHHQLEIKVGLYVPTDYTSKKHTSIFRICLGRGLMLPLVSGLKFMDIRGLLVPVININRDLKLPFSPS